MSKICRLVLLLVFSMAIPSWADQPEWVAAEIRRIDLENSKVTLRHEEIPSLNMSGMTMVFTVRDKAKLSSVKVGDAVLFSVVGAEGKLVVTDIKPAEDHSGH